MTLRESIAGSFQTFGPSRLGNLVQKQRAATMIIFYTSASSANSLSFPYITVKTIRKSTSSYNFPSSSYSWNHFRRSSVTTVGASQSVGLDEIVNVLIRTQRRIVEVQAMSRPGPDVPAGAVARSRVIRVFDSSSFVGRHQAVTVTVR